MQTVASKNQLLRYPNLEALLPEIEKIINAQGSVFVPLLTPDRDAYSIYNAKTTEGRLYLTKYPMIHGMSGKTGETFKALNFIMAAGFQGGSVNSRVGNIDAHSKTFGYASPSNAPGHIGDEYWVCAWQSETPKSHGFSQEDDAWLKRNFTGLEWPAYALSGPKDFPNEAFIYFARPSDINLVIRFPKGLSRLEIRERKAEYLSLFGDHVYRFIQKR